MEYKLEPSQELLLKQSISMQQIEYLKLLEMNTAELEQYLYSIYEENPVVELNSAEPCAEGSEFFSWLNQSSAPKEYQSSPDEEIPPEKALPNQILDEKKNLLSHLKNQFDLSLREIDLSLLNLLLASLDKRGYLNITEEEIMQKGYELDLIQEAVGYLQSLEPAGIGARDLKECLSLQLIRKEIHDPLYFSIIEHYLEDISRGYFQKVAKALKCDVKRVRKIYEEIQSLNPIPASGFGSDPTFTAIVPDITVAIDRSGELHILYNKNFEKEVSISQRYLNLASENQEVEDYIKEKASQAMWVMKSLHSRQRTIENVVSEIVQVQKDFFTEGAALKPLNMVEVADKISVHESTVSRAVSGKYLECQRGVFPLKYFFTGKVSQPAGQEEAVSSVDLQNRIREIIAGEDQRKPYSDSSIIKILEEDGVQVARRTVAKYRSELGIPSSSMRKKC